MASSPQRPSFRNGLSVHSVSAAEDDSVIGHELTRQPKREPRWTHDTLPRLSAESRVSSTTGETPPEAPIHPELDHRGKGTITQRIQLEQVNLVQVFHRHDGSFQGISFNYHDGDLVELGHCEAVTGGEWHPWVRPALLLYVPRRRRPIRRGFVPVREIGFVGSGAGPVPKTKAIKMLGELEFRLSGDGLEIDSGGVEVFGVVFRCDQPVKKQAAQAVKRWLGNNRTLSRLFGKFRAIGTIRSRLTK